MPATSLAPRGFYATAPTAVLALISTFATDQYEESELLEFADLSYTACRDGEDAERCRHARFGQSAWHHMIEWSDVVEEFVHTAVIRFLTRPCDTAGRARYCISGDAALPLGLALARLYRTLARAEALDGIEGDLDFLSFEWPDRILMRRSNDTRELFMHHELQNEITCRMRNMSGAEKLERAERHTRENSFANVML